MTTASIKLSPIAPGQTVVAGPFEWTPSQLGHECMLMSVSADGDPSNIDPSTDLQCAKGPIPDFPFVPFDNNFAQRNVAPVAGGGGSDALRESLQGKQFWVCNPYDSMAQMNVEVQIPAFLRNLVWNFTLRSTDGSSQFQLSGGMSRRFTISVH